MAATGNTVVVSSRRNSRTIASEFYFGKPSLPLADLMESVRGDILRMVVDLPFWIASWRAPEIPVIYFIVSLAGNVPEIVYVGKAVNFAARMRGHRLRGLFIGGSDEHASCQVNYKPLDREQFCNLQHEESFYITALRPKYNKISNCSVYPTHKPELFIFPEGEI